MEDEELDKLIMNKLKGTFFNDDELRADAFMKRLNKDSTRELFILKLLDLSSVKRDSGKNGKFIIDLERMFPSIRRHTIRNEILTLEELDFITIKKETMNRAERRTRNKGLMFIFNINNSIAISFYQLLKERVILKLKKEDGADKNG